MRTNVKTSTPTPTALNAEGTVVRALTPEQELRRTVMTCLLWEDSFYEGGVGVAERIKDLIPRVGFDKVARMAFLARTEMKLRHVPLLLARELARMKAGRKMGDLLYDIIQRPDEIGEFLSLYWKDGKKSLAKQVKKGLARAFGKFTEFQLAKYNQDNAIKLRDVAFLTHIKPASSGRGEMMARLVNRDFIPERTKSSRFSVRANYGMPKDNPGLEVPDTWEVQLSAGKDKKETFERLIREKQLGALALLRNLRGMQEAKVEDGIIRQGLLGMDVERVLPFRFIAAAQYAPRFEVELEDAMFRCLDGSPKLEGRTALIVDTSPSMWQSKVSQRSEMTRFDAAAALAILCREICEQCNVYAFNERAYIVPARRGFALRDALKDTRGNASCGGLAVEMANQHGYDRIIVLTDGQWHYLEGPLGYAGPSYKMGDAQTVSPAPLTNKAYMINVSTQKNGVGYGKWHSIDGWSESIIEYIRAFEQADLD